jgi:hypothetical protein
VRSHPPGVPGTGISGYGTVPPRDCPQHSAHYCDSRVPRRDVLSPEDLRPNESSQDSLASYRCGSLTSMHARVRVCARHEGPRKTKEECRPGSIGVCKASAAREWITLYFACISCGALPQPDVSAANVRTRRAAPSQKIESVAPGMWWSWPSMKGTGQLPSFGQVSLRHALLACELSRSECSGSARREATR